MELKIALETFDALSHETRLWVFRILVQAGPQGLTAGEIAESLGTLQNTMSGHLKQLYSTGLVNRSRDGRHVIYSANFKTVRALVAFLLEDCCAGHCTPRKPVEKSLSTSTENTVAST